jgi:predicted helicase
LAAEWNKYVPEQLLPRLNGFELMMAPYAVAHMKLAMVLKDTGYDFASNSRLRVYLTNSLEEAGSSDEQMSLFDDPLAIESIEANGVKKNNGINVVVGNPPYSISSANKGDWILSLLDDYKKGLNERKVNLDDDYIKFIRFGQHIISQTTDGILAYISNNSFLDGITHREMRRQLLEMCSSIYVINLHGNSKKKEKSPDGGKDENVFDIQQGVSINIFVARKGNNKSDCKLYSCDLFGLRDAKYDILRNNNLSDLDFALLEPEAPNYFFVPKDFSNSEDYQKVFSVPELLPLYNSGVQTKRDKLVISFDASRVESVLDDFSKLPVETLRVKYELPADGRDWTIESAKKDIIMNNPQIIPLLYRPFDYRYTAYTGRSKGFMGYPRETVFKHFVGHKNIGLLVRRNTPPVEFTHAFVCDTLISEGVLGIDPNGREYVFPLYLAGDDEGYDNARYNISTVVLGNVRKSLNNKTITSEELFFYTYAVLYSPKYRSKFAEFLKIDFPKIPYPSDEKAFYRLVALGKQLVELHLLDFDITICDAAFVGSGSNVVSKLKYDAGRVYINKDQYFSYVPSADWNQLMGGYAPLQKWMKLRKDRQLSREEVECYIKSIYSMKRTREIMGQIDEFTSF